MAKINIKGDIVVNAWGWIYDFFGLDHVTPQMVLDTIDATPDDESIDVYINSGGGHVTAGQEIYSALRDDPRVHIHVVGMACSAASIIAMAGDSDISPVGMVMVHNVSGYAEGDCNEMEKAERELRSMNEALAMAYEAKSGMESDKLLEMMDRETWLTARQCVEYGLIDRISKPKQKAMAVNSIDYGLSVTPEMVAEAEFHRKAMQEEEAKRAEKAKALLDDLDAYGV